MQVRLLLFLLIFQVTPPEVDSGEAIPLSQLLSGRNHQKYLREDYHDKIEILRKALERRSNILPNVVRQRDMDLIFQTLAEIRGLVAAGHQISLEVTDEDERRHKEVKKMEIELRKLNEELGDQKLAVPLEDRDEFDRIQVLIEDFRNRLLQQLFGRVIGATSPRSPQVPPRAPVAVNSLAPTGFRPTASAQRRGLHDIDKFTEDEFTKVQYAQELVKRTEVFLEIAESRLDEIERRRDGREWEEEEPNPLELYMYEDLLHGYVRAVDGIMVNIDNHARCGRVEEKDLMKALEKLDEKIDGFIERLQAMEDLVRKQLDKGFYEKWREALKTSDIARKGAAYGLGAPKD